MGLLLGTARCVARALVAYTTTAACLSHWWLTPHLPLVCRACPLLTPHLPLVCRACPLPTRHLPLVCRTCPLHTRHLPLVCRAYPVRALCSSGEGLVFVRGRTLGDIGADWLSNCCELHEKFKKQHKSAVRRAGKQRSKAAGGGRR